MPSRAQGALLLPTLAVLAALASPALASPDGDLLKGPYLQHLSRGSVDLNVELAAPAPVTVTVTPDARDAGKPLSFSSPAAPFHSVMLSGLAPSTRYRYSLRVGTGPAHDGTFVTAPPDSSHEPFTFVAFGDNRSDGAAHARIVQAIAKESYDFLVNTGDFVIEGASESAWQTFFDVEEPILKDHCLFACIGNHELVNDQAATHFQRYLGPNESLPGEAPNASTPPYGSFRWGRARFFLLNAFKEDFQAGTERSWLEAELARADHEAGLDTRVVVIHHGPYSAGLHGKNKALLDAHIDELFVAHHVDLVLQGHDHIYERGEAHGLKYILTGGGGAPLYSDTRPVPSTRKVETTFNYVLATVSDATIAIVAKRPDGSTIEECSFARGGSWLCDAVKTPPAPGAIPSATEAHQAPSSSGWPGCSVARARGAGDGLSPVTAMTLGGLVALLAVRRRSRRRDGAAA